MVLNTLVNLEVESTLISEIGTSFGTIPVEMIKKMQ